MNVPMVSMKRKQTCCVPGCKDSWSKRHRFPKDDEKLFQEWRRNVGHQRFPELTPTQIYKSYCVCDIHFEAKYIVPGTKRGLRKDAVPTLGLPPPTALEGVQKNVDVEITAQQGGKSPVVPVEDSHLLKRSGSAEVSRVSRWMIAQVQEKENKTQSGDASSPLSCVSSLSWDLFEVADSDSPSTPRDESSTSPFFEDGSPLDPPSFPKYGILRDVAVHRTEGGNQYTLNDTEQKEMCTMCLEVAVLMNIDSFAREKELDSFKFLEDAIGTEMPSSACEQCISKLNCIGGYVRQWKQAQLTLKRKEQCYKTMESLLARQLVDHALYIQQHSWSNFYLPKKICPTCGAQIVTRGDHYKESKECRPKNFKCPQCDQYFVSGLRLRRHQKKHEYNKPCPNCPRMFKLDEHLQKHLLTHRISNSQRCSADSPTEMMCHKCGKGVKFLRDHYRESPGCKPRNYKCPYCNKFLTGIHQLEQHKKVHEFDEREALICHICSKTFKYEHNLRRHLDVHMMGKRFVCEVCGKAFTTKVHLQDHKNRHNQVRPHVCRYCDASFASKSVRHTHERKRHMIIPGTSTLSTRVYRPEQHGRYVCHICEREFTLNRILKVHLRSHFDDDVRICKKCNTEFDDKTQYKEHLRMHRLQLKMTYWCTICGKRFSGKAAKDNHVRIHTGERPFACSHCDGKFTTQARLMYHRMLAHNINKGKPFQCKYCEKTFNLKGNKVAHERIHTGEKPYKCHVCGMDFIGPSSRKKHVRFKHGEEEVENIVNI